MNWLSHIYRWNFLHIFLICIGCIVFWGMLYQFICSKKFWKITNIIFTIISLSAILKFTIIGRNTSPIHQLSIRTVQMIIDEPELIREMVMNTFLYFPLGLCGVYSLPTQIRHKCLICTLLAFILSLTIEFIQYFFGMGLCEPSDVVTNTLGATIGSLSYILSNWLRKRKEKRKVENT